MIDMIDTHMIHYTLCKYCKYFVLTI